MRPELAHKAATLVQIAETTTTEFSRIAWPDSDGKGNSPMSDRLDLIVIGVSEGRLMVTALHNHSLGVCDDCTYERFDPNSQVFIFEVHHD